MLKGVGLEYVWRETLILVAMAAVLLTAAPVVQREARVAMRRILFLAQAEVLHIVRDRATLAQVLVVAVVQLLVLSNAATFEIRNTPI